MINNLKIWSVETQIMMIIVLAIECTLHDHDVGSGVNETEIQKQCSLVRAGGIYSDTCVCVCVYMDATTMHSITIMFSVMGLLVPATLGPSRSPMSRDMRL